MLNSVQTYFLKRRLSSSRSSETVHLTGSKIGVLFNQDVSNRDQLQEMIEKNFEVCASDINFLGFSTQSYKNANKPSFVIVNKDFNLFGQPNSEIISEFLNHNYKLLFNFFGKDEFYLENVAQLTKANLKIGLSKSNENINDLLLDLKLGNLSFFEESSKYIKHII